MSETTENQQTGPEAVVGAETGQDAAKDARGSASRSRKTNARRATKKVTVIMAGTSYGATAGDRQQVEPDRAEDLVRAGLARYPAGKKA